MRRLIKRLDFRKARTVLLYLPIHGEADVTNLFSNKTLNKKFALPKVVKKNKKLDLYWVSSLNDVETGTYGILEPLKHLKKASTKEIDLAIVPGIVFGENGHRIGFGKGFYDRLLKNLSCPKIGIAYEFQIVKNISGEQHDVPVDAIVTEKRSIKAKHTL